MSTPSRTRIVILGSTGSIGTQTLDIVRRLPQRLEVVGLAAHRNASVLAAQAREFGVRTVAVTDHGAAAECRQLCDDTCRVLSGLEGIVNLATLPEADVVVVAVAGAIGIRPTHAAIRSGKRIALASKEVLVAAGRQTMDLARHAGVPILPIDSEHSALFQCMIGHTAADVERLYLTASGGPFRDASLETMRRAQPEDALRHPTWSMGGLVTINSATLMNKGLEIIEAFWLFGVPASQIEVVIHPQSIVHSMVRFRDGSVLAQLGLPDMRLPIQYALVYPERLPTELPRLEPTACALLEFSAPDDERFPALGIARRALQIGGTMPAVMNAANEAAVEFFLKRRLGFLGIMQLVQAVMAEHDPVEESFDNVLQADSWARQRACALAPRFHTQTE